MTTPQEEIARDETTPPYPTRICSLLPSATEIVAWLGLADRLVGVSAECDWPAEVRDLPVVTASRIDTQTLPGREVDEAVRAAIADGRSLYGIDEELVERLDPDLVITQDLCAVCAVSSQELGSLCSVSAETVSLDARSIPEIERCVLTLADRLGVPVRGKQVVAEMQERQHDMRERVRGRGQPRVFVCEWVDPPFAAGHWVPEMVALAGGSEILGRAGAPSFQTTWEAVRAAGPDLIVLAPCGFDADRTAREARQGVSGGAWLRSLGCPVVAVDANARFSRPAPRVAEGVAQLGFLLHPEVVPDPGLPSVRLA